MIKFFTKRMNNRKGFTLIELIVVIAILGILAAIAIPRFTGFRNEATVKAEAATGISIISAARVQEAENGTVIAAEVTKTNLPEKYMVLPAAPKYTLGKTDGTATYNLAAAPSKDLYVISWKSAASGYEVIQYAVEGHTFVAKAE